MALGGGEVDHAPGRQDVEEAPVAEVVLEDERPDLAGLGDGELAQAGQVDLDVEVAGVREDRPVLHALEVLAAQDARDAGDGDEDVAALGRGQPGHDLVALHAGLERGHRIDLADDHRRAGAARSLGDAAAGGAVAEHDHGAAGEQDVGRAQDAVERGLASAVAVVEGALRARLVDGEDRARQDVLGGHRTQPHETGDRLLGRTRECRRALRIGVERGDQVGAVVERDARLAGGEVVEVRRVGVEALAPHREHVDAVLGDKRRGNVVLRRERVGRTDRDRGATTPKSGKKVRRLRRDVETSGDRDAVKRPIDSKACGERL